LLGTEGEGILLLLRLVLLAIVFNDTHAIQKLFSKLLECTMDTLCCSPVGPPESNNPWNLPH
jgi:hypothetical protein